MAFRTPFSRLPQLARPIVQRRAFSHTPRVLAQRGDAIPNIDVLVEDSPGNKVNLAEEFQTTNGYIVGVPGAFSGTCSAQHIPSWINHPKLRDAGQVFVVAVNDAFV